MSRKRRKTSSRRWKAPLSRQTRKTVKQRNQKRKLLRKKTQRPQITNHSNNLRMGKGEEASKPNIEEITEVSMMALEEILINTEATTMHSVPNVFHSVCVFILFQ